MNQNTSTAITTIDQAKALTKPPPTKKVLIEATATALYRENQKLIAEADEKTAEIRKRRDAFLKKHCRKLFHTASVSTNSWNLTYAEFKIQIDPAILDPFIKETNAVARPKSKSIKDYIEMLRESTQPQDSTVEALLADKAISSKLLQLGRKMIGQTS